MALRNKRRATRPMIAEINVVPYIDVMLVLLIIFMVTAPLLQQGVEVDLPKTQAELLPQEKQPPLIITVNQEGLLFLNVSDTPKQSIEPDILVIRLAAEKAKRPDRQVLIRGDHGSNYGQVVKAMVIAQKAGVDHIGLMTDDEGA